MHLIPNPLIIPVGVIIGILSAAPVGPVNVLCIQRAVERGFWGGVAAGLGAAMGDGLIAVFAALGISAIAGVAAEYRTAFQIVGGLVLTGFGMMLLARAPRLEPAELVNGRPARLRDFAWDIPKTFFLTITNPGAVVGMFALVGGVGMAVQIRGTLDALTLVAAIMAGSVCWWVVLSHFVGRIRHRLDSARLNQINRAAGCVLIGFGVLLIAEIAVNGTG